MNKGFSPPNYTQTPNEFFDHMAKTLKEGELRVLLVIMRQTFGWRKRWDQISLSQLEEKTGMSRTAVSDSLTSLIKKGIVIRHSEGPKGRVKNWYTLSTEEPEKEPEIEDEFNESPPNSNNSYRSTKTTTPSSLKLPPPSSLKLPTKETITKDIYKEKEKESALARVKEKPAKACYLSLDAYPNLKITEDEMDRLKEDYHDCDLSKKMKALQEYSIMKAKVFKEYTNHNMVIRKWLREDKIIPTKKEDAKSLQPKISFNQWLDKTIPTEFIKEGKVRFMAGNILQFSALPERPEVDLDRMPSAELISHYLRKISDKSTSCLTSTKSIIERMQI